MNNNQWEIHQKENKFLGEIMNVENDFRLLFTNEINHFLLIYFSFQTKTLNLQPAEEKLRLVTAFMAVC